MKSVVMPLCLCLAGAAFPAVAELGGDASSVARGRAPLAALQAGSPDGRFTVHESEAPGGTRVREYLSPAGRVFAVTWRGPHMPDLRRLFGPHFESYRQLAAAKRPGRGPLAVAGPELVVQSGGRMRAFVGRAYLLPLVPPGVAIDELN